MSAKFYPGIHALRGVAAVFVVVQHAIVLPFVMAGVNFSAVLRVDPSYVGVLMFFCLSGFVIGTNRDLPTTEFAGRRALRIYPAYWLACIMAFCLARFGATPISMTPWTLFLLPTDNLAQINVAYWTLIYEVFFYALAAIVFAMRLSDNKLTIVVIAWVIIIHLCSSYTVNVNVAQPGWWLPLERYNQFFAIGLLCAIHLDRLRSIGSATYMISGLLAFVASEVASYHSVILHSLFYAVFVASIMMAATHAVRIPRWLNVLGDSSYGIYLTHYFVIMFFAPIARGYGMSLQWTVIVVLVAALVPGIAFGLLEARLYKRLAKLIWSRSSNLYASKASALGSSAPPS